MERLESRRTLHQQMDGLRAEIDLTGSMGGLDAFGQQAFDLVAGAKAQAAFDLSREPAKVIERYGPHDWARQALLARRFVEAGVSLRHAST
jgi:hypothetical protein